MAHIRPFAAQRFTPQAGDLRLLVAPPYDVLSPAQRDEYASKSAYNTAWLTLPERLPDDRSQFVMYGRSASRLAEWRREGILAVDERAGLYRYKQTFEHPLLGERLTRTALICLLKVEPYENGVVLPHEQTFPKHKEDRLRLLEATRSHLECIFGLYQDDDASVEASMNGAAFEMVATVKTEDGVSHELAVCVNESEISAISDALAGRRIWIADGHHRYETAMKFRGQTEGVGPIAEDFMLIGLSSMHDPGLTLLPTHRIVKGVNLSKSQVQTKLQSYFNVRTEANDMLPEVVSSLDAPDTRAFGVALPGGSGLVVTMEQPGDAVRLIGGDASPRLKTLDVSILHELIVEKSLGVNGLDRIEYTRDAGEAVKRVEKSADTIAIITNPPSVQDMKQIAEGGEKMPQKSTYYYPKFLSGLIFWSLADF